MVYQFTATDTANILSTAGGLVGDYLPVILIFIGLSVGFAIWDKLTHRN